MRTIFIFRRDLRLADNTGLIAALKSSETVLPCFILDPEQLRNHAWRSEFAFQFMLESLIDLNAQLERSGSRLHVFEGRPAEVVGQLLKRGFDAVVVNRDYTPFSQSRDAAIQDVCRTNNVRFVSHGDALLFEPEDVVKAYRVYSAFKRFVRELPGRMPVAGNRKNYDVNVRFDLGVDRIRKMLRPSADAFIQGGRAHGRRLLAKLKSLHAYDRDRDFPARDGTSRLSAYHKLGCISIRETAAMAQKVWGDDSPFYHELLWRDFFTHVAGAHPTVFGAAFKPAYDAISWRHGGEHFERWCQGETGFPLVDAGMRQLNRTGYMHNRVRMVVAGFLTKDLRIDWREGERYFASRLIDYDPCVNNGNWQWAAGTGCDAQPYFRIFNPWRQQRLFDADCEYIRRWVPALAGLSAKEIHGLERGKVPLQNKYPQPMVDHKKEAALTLKMFKRM